MKRFFRWDKKYFYWGVTAFFVIACAILFYMALNYIPLLKSGLSSLARILSPFIWGLVISYLIAPVMNFFEGNIFSPLGAWLYKKNKRKDGSGFARAMSVLCAEIFLIIVLVGLVYLIIPQLYQSIETIISSMPVYIDTATKWLTKLFEDYPVIDAYVADMLSAVYANLMEFLQTTVMSKFAGLVSNVTTGFFGALKGLYNLIIGIIVSVYLLGDKEHFLASCKKTLYSIFTPEAVQQLMEGLGFVDRTFTGFIAGKLLDSAIIGIICYIGCAIMKTPYALLVSVIIGVTNIIPFFGPFIGAIPTTLIILLADPIKGLMFLVFVLLLQQVDGNFIGPKILGNTIGINGFWVMFAIIFGAGLFGFWGMLLGVPVFVVIYTLANNRIEKKLKRSDLPWETEDYVGVDYIDPVSHKPVRDRLKDDDEKNFDDDF